MSSEFEKRLSRQPVKQIPSEWRAEIVCAAKEAQAERRRIIRLSRRSETQADRSLLLTINSRLSALLWPHPAAWAGLATVWIFVFTLNFSLREQPAVPVAKAASPSPEVIAQLHEQHKLYAELMGITGADTRDADRPRLFSPKPRSERAEILAA